MNAFLNVLDEQGISAKTAGLTRGELTTLQVNMGNLCNQECRHCHVGASPQGRRIMSKKVIDDILGFLDRVPGLILDITGGAPELNPHFEYFIKQARPKCAEIIVRSNLSILLEKGREHLPQLFRENRVRLICSLPCYGRENVDAQRGDGVFGKSIKALKSLNGLGYGRDPGLELDLVYNPGGAFLPPHQDELRKEYAEHLKKDFNIVFNRLVTITNVPIRRFRDYLEASGKYEEYIELLKDNFNPDTVGSIMCRQFLSVGYDGKVYDCDFNQSLGWALKDNKTKPLNIASLDPQELENRQIMVGEHCLSCTAGYGSSCQGALSETEQTEGRDGVQQYYGKVLKTRNDLKTGACCSAESFPEYVGQIIKDVHPEIIDKFYGCGSPIPPAIEGATVLDLGCGTGRDVYVVSRLAGEKGKVIGVDMTDEQLQVADKFRAYQAKKFGYKKSNVDFKKGYIEDLAALGIEDNSVDVVISNCVINLSFDKQKVFSEIFRVLKPGGELYFSDVFAGRRVPEELRHDQVLVGECLAGALYIEDFRRLLRANGCPDYRVLSSRRIGISDTRIKEKTGTIDFYSRTVRAFKLKGLEDICEDYGQTAVYRGTIAHYPHSFVLDDHHEFITSKPVLVCGNTAAMLEQTRLSGHFAVHGDRSVHYGPFKCLPVAEAGDIGSGGCC